MRSYNDFSNMTRNLLEGRSSVYLCRWWWWWDVEGFGGVVSSSSSDQRHAVIGKKRRGRQVRDIFGVKNPRRRL
jgi:hypothetical protein